MQRLFICLTLAAIAIPSFPVNVEAETKTRIGHTTQTPKILT